MLKFWLALILKDITFETTYERYQEFWTRYFTLIDAILHINEKKQNNCVPEFFPKAFSFCKSMVAGPTVEANRRSSVDSPRIHSAAKVYLGLVRNNRNQQFTHSKSKDNATLGTTTRRIQSLCYRYINSNPTLKGVTTPMYIYCSNHQLAD